MTRFIYIADTHLGADPMGYQQQKGYPEKLPEILAALCNQLSIDFILHGGDMVDSAANENIRAAASAFDLDVPVYLCLGNHDLTVTDAVDRWMELAPAFFKDDSPNYSIPAEDCLIHIVPNHWAEEPYYWEDTQKAYFTSEQLELLSHALNIRPDLPHILLTHSPVYGLPLEQTGMSEPYHSPETSFTMEIAALAAKHANLECMLGAHNHMNMCVNQDETVFVTVSALTETPFECKLFEVSPQRIEMSTIPLQPVLSFEGEYDTSKAYVQGRPADRAFIRRI